MDHNILSLKQSAKLFLSRQDSKKAGRSHKIIEHHFSRPNDATMESTLPSSESTSNSTAWHSKQKMERPTPALWFDRIGAMTKAQTYKCPNPDCFCEVTVFIQPANGNRPRCRCGAEMKKPYTEPVLTGKRPVFLSKVLFT